MRESDNYNQIRSTYYKGVNQSPTIFNRKSGIFTNFIDRIAKRDEIDKALKEI